MFCSHLLHPPAQLLHTGCSHGVVTYSPAPHIDILPLLCPGAASPAASCRCPLPRARCWLTDVEADARPENCLQDESVSQAHSSSLYRAIDVSITHSMLRRDGAGSVQAFGRSEHARPGTYYP